MVFPQSIITTSTLRRNSSWRDVHGITEEPGGGWGLGRVQPGVGVCIVDGGHMFGLDGGCPDPPYREEGD